MLEGSSHHTLNYNDIEKERKSKDIINFSPVLEKIEEYESVEEKGLNKQNNSKEEIKNNKEILKDSVITSILDGLENNNNAHNKSLVIKPKSLFNNQNNQKRRNLPKKSLKQFPSAKKLLDIIGESTKTEKKKITFNIVQPTTSLSKIHANIKSKKDNAINKNKRKTVALFYQKSTKQALNLSGNYNDGENIKTTLRGNYITYGTDTNQKLLAKPNKKYSGLSLSRVSDDLRFSSLIKKNKIQLVKGFVFKSKSKNNEKKINFIRTLLDDPKIKEREDLIKRIKIYSFIQSVCSLISILLSIIDTALFSKYSYDYAIKNNIEYKELYIIGERTINPNENITRVLNGIFSGICLIMTFFIFFAKFHFSKTKEDKILNKRNKNTNNNLNFIHEFIHKHNNGAKQKSLISKLILRSIINIIFYPPKVNYVYYYYANNILCIYPVNSFFLLICSLKLYNIYRCIFYFIPVTATLGKTLCEKYNVKLNVKFMFKTIISNHKIIFPCCILFIILTLITILLKSVEEFSVDMIQYKNLESYTYNNKTKIILDNNLNIYNTLWVYSSFLLRNPSGELCPRTPLGKILLFIFYIIGSLFLCTIYYRLNNLMQLNRSSIQAYSKLQKLFQPENKENKASDVILAVILLKKYNNLFAVKEMKETFVNQEHINKKRRTIFDIEIERLRQKKALIFRSKKIFFVRVKFVFFLKFFADFKNYINNFKTSRKHPVNISSMVQNLEGKLDENLESISVKLASIDSIDSIFERLKNNDCILMRKLQRLKNYDNFILTYLLDLVNCQNSLISKKKREFQTRIVDRLSLTRSKTKMVLNFKSCKSLKES